MVIPYSHFILKDFISTPKHFCHPNAKMTSPNLEAAKEECLHDPLCNMFYKVCNDTRFRKCNETAYEEESGCYEPYFVPSSLYKKRPWIMKRDYFCHPYTNMTSTTLDDAKHECRTDPLCNMFYEDCTNKFRKCKETAHEEASVCGDHIIPSTLYKKGDIHCSMLYLVSIVL